MILFHLHPGFGRLSLWEDQPRSCVPPIAILAVTQIFRTRESTREIRIAVTESAITDSRPSDLIKIKLEFVKPFTATNATDFIFTPQGNQTNVKWTMSGENNFVAKAFSMFMNMDKMVGTDFEKGLGQLKTVSEAAAK